jgi:hypothetical protein
MVERKNSEEARKKFQFSNVNIACLEYIYSRLIEFIIEFKTMLLLSTG